MKTIFVASCLAAGILSIPLQAQAFSLNATYYKVVSDPDFQNNACCNVYTNEVTGTLGPHGLPVYNSGYGGVTLNDVNSSGELTWWSPTYNSNVKFTGTGSITLPYNSNSLYPPNSTGSGDGSGFETAVFSGNLVLPTSESVKFTFGADDDALLFVDGQSVSQVGGIHGVSAAPVTTSVLSAGGHTLELFYADRQTTGAGLYFSLDTQGVSLSGVPLPSSLPLFGAALLGLGAVGYGMKRKAAKASSAA